MTSMQAVSGAGYPGIPTLDILGNVVPYIGGEEEKVERETRSFWVNGWMAMWRWAILSSAPTVIA